jgi:hypothetical protein
VKNKPCIWLEKKVGDSGLIDCVLDDERDRTENLTPSLYLLIQPDFALLLSWALSIDADIMIIIGFISKISQTSKG